MLDEAQRYFDAAFDNAPIGMALFNTDGEYVRVNARCAGCSAARPTSCSAAATRSSRIPTTARRTSRRRGRSSRASSHAPVREALRRPDGAVVWALANLTFLRDERAGR